MLEELIYTSLGASALIRNKIEDEIKSLEENGKLKKKDAKSFLKSLKKSGKKEDKKIKKHFKKLLDEAIDELGLVTKKDLKELKVKIRNGEIKEEVDSKEIKENEIKNGEIK